MPMTDKLQPLVWLSLTVLAVYLWGNCRESAGAAKQRLRDATHAVTVRSDATDRRVARMAAESLELGARLLRYARTDSVARQEIARLRRYIKPDIPGSAPGDTLVAQLAIRDAVIDQLIAERDAVDSQKTIWQALAGERGDLLRDALQERDAYKAISHAWQGKAGKRFGCTGGPAVLATLGGHVSAGVGVVCGIHL